MSTGEAPLHPFIRPVDAAGLGERVCHVCSDGPDGDKITADGVIPGRRFVEFRVAVLTPSMQAGSTAGTTSRRDRDDRARRRRRSVTVRHENMVICETCLTAAARMLGLGTWDVSRWRPMSSARAGRDRRGPDHPLKGELENYVEVVEESGPGSVTLAATVARSERERCGFGPLAGATSSPPRSSRCEPSRST